MLFRSKTTPAAASRIIEKDFADYRDWYRLNWGNPHWWSAQTRKIKDPAYTGPDGAKLTLDVKIAKDATLFFVVRDNGWNAFPKQTNGEYYARVNIKGSAKWQSVGVTVADFKPVDQRTKHPLKSWRRITELGIRGRIAVMLDGKKTELPAKPTNWTKPRALRNLRWEGGQYTQGANTPDAGKTMTQTERKKQFQKAIDDSIKLEKRDEK